MLLCLWLDLIVLQMIPSSWQSEDELGPLPYLALDADFSMVQIHKILHQRESDSRAFEPARFQSRRNSPSFIV
jgi:hypothetical protein